MQTTSATWKSLWASGAALECRATINSVAYTDVAPVIRRGAMQSGLRLGNAVSASCSLQLRTTNAIPKSAAVVVEIRLNDGTTASEWLPAGTFYISRRTRDPLTGLLGLECYDALLKANAIWEPSAGTWPRTMAAVATELAAILGVSIDSRTVIGTGAEYMIYEPQAGLTIRDVLGIIAQGNGGNWVMTPDNKLRLVALADAADAASATGDVLDVTAVLSAIYTGDAVTVTGVRNTIDGITTLTGDETGAVVDTTLTATLAVELANNLIGLEYRAFTLSQAVYDPAAEIGDYVRYGNIASVICIESITLGPAVRGSIGAPDPGELTDEYPYIGASARALTLAKAYAQEVVGEFDDTLTQEEIFNRLTDNGAAQGMLLVNGQLYVNASYINTGTLSADRIRGGTLVLGGNAGQYGSIEVYDAANAMIGTWGYNSLRVLGQRGISVGRTATGQLHSEINKDYFRLELADEDVDSIVAEITTLLDASTGTRICRISSGNGENESSERIELRSKAVRIAPHGSAQAIGVSIEGNLAISGSLSIGNRTGVSGSFTTADGKAVTVNNGIITGIA